MHKISFYLVAFLFIFWNLTSCHGPNRKPEFKSYLINSKASDKAHGNIVAADFDNDGDNDAMLSNADDNKLYWYEYINDSTWKDHLVGYYEHDPTGLAVADVDKDGYMDLVMNRAWFRNPGVLQEEPGMPWEMYYYQGGVKSKSCEIVAADFDNDSVKDILCFSEPKRILRWYDAGKPMEWDFYTITDSVHMQIYSGLEPGGAGDINNDGLPDIVMPFYWYKNPGNKEMKWTKRTWPYQKADTAGAKQSVLTWVGDIDEDGDNDIIYAHKNQLLKNSGVFWVENLGEGMEWETHDISTQVEGLRAIQSLGMYDFNEDKYPDLFFGSSRYKKEAGSIRTDHRAVILINKGRKNRVKFDVASITDSRYDWYRVNFGDVDADGDIDIISKSWNPTSEAWDLVYWKNILIDYQPEK